MFKKIFLTLALVAMSCMLFASNSFAGANSAEVEVRATFSRALIVTAGDPIIFGNILTNSNAGTVSIDKQTSDITFSGGVVNVDDTNSQRGYISFVGPRPGNVGITYDGTVPLTHDSVAGATVNFAPAAKVTAYNISIYNEFVQIEIGGTVSFGSDVTEGLYSGSVTITVDYT